MSMHVSHDSIERKSWMEICLNVLANEVMFMLFIASALQEKQAMMAMFFLRRRLKKTFQHLISFLTHSYFSLLFVFD